MPSKPQELGSNPGGLSQTLLSITRLYCPKEKEGISLMLSLVFFYSHHFITSSFPESLWNEISKVSNNFCQTSKQKLSLPLNYKLLRAETSYPSASLGPSTALGLWPKLHRRWLNQTGTVQRFLFCFHLLDIQNKYVNERENKAWGVKRTFSS